MAELLLLNPRKRRARKAPKRASNPRRRRNPVAAVSRRRRRNPIAAVSSVGRRRRRRNPIASVGRRRNPIALRSARKGRRRNPIAGGLSVKGLMRTLTDAAIMGAGAIGVDMAYAQVNRMLPATLQPVPGQVGVGDAVKAVLTAALGAVLNRPTKGIAGKAALGSLTVQARDIAAKMLTKAGVPMAGVAGMGYYYPAAIVNRSARVGPNRSITNNGAGQGMAAYLPPGRTPLLNGAGQRVGAYLPPGRTPLLNSAPRGGREGNRYR